MNIPMKEIFDKFSSYRFFNYLYPGLIFGFTLDQLSSLPVLKEKDVLFNVVVCYTYGLIISRIGSLLIDKVLKKLNFIVAPEYRKLLITSKEDYKIEILLEQSHMYRTICALILTTYISLLLCWLTSYLCVTTILYHFAFPALLAVFIISYIKQYNFYKLRVNTVYKILHSKPLNVESKEI